MSSSCAKSENDEIKNAIAAFFASEFKLMKKFVDVEKLKIEFEVRILKKKLNK